MGKLIFLAITALAASGATVASAFSFQSHEGPKGNIFNATCSKVDACSNVCVNVGTTNSKEFVLSGVEQCTHGTIVDPCNITYCQEKAFSQPNCPAGYGNYDGVSQQRPSCTASVTTGGTSGAN